MWVDLWGSSGSLFITGLVSLFVIVDPPGNVFPYLALSAGYGPEASRALARRACLYAFLILALFVFLGRVILTFFGISLAAFQIAGGLILLRISLDMLEGRGHFNRIDTSSSLEAADYRDIALVPLAVPMLSGPGAITVILVLESRTHHALDSLVVLAALGLVMFLTYVFFRFATPFLEFLKESGLRLITRIMGMILVALAVQFIIQGVKAVLAS